MCFYRYMRNLSHHYDYSNCSPTRLLIQRHDVGFCVINKKGEWDRAEVVLCGVRSGTWQELVYGFDIVVGDDGRIVKWGDGGEVGLNIGAREALFFVNKGYSNA
jgi:hypothetical protein